MACVRLRQVYVLAATKQPYEYFCSSSVHPSVTPFLPLSSYHYEIFRSNYYWQKWCTCNRSKVKVTEVKPQFSRFQTISPVWIHIWQYNDAQSIGEALYWFSRSSLNFQGYTRQKIADFDLNWAFPDHNFSLNTQMATKMMHKAWSCMEEVPHYFSRSPVKFWRRKWQQIAAFDPNL